MSTKTARESLIHKTKKIGGQTPVYASTGSKHKKTTTKSPWKKPLK